MLPFVSVKFLPRVLLASLLFTTKLAKSYDWSYDGETGPDHWQDQCQGKSQSPINLDRSGSRTIDEIPFKFVNYEKLPDDVEISNVGTTIKLKHGQTDSGKVALLAGGGLNGTFQFSQLHFHWGVNNSLGSEHTINNASYPAELHLVHFNKRYGSDLATAVSNGRGAQDTLAVLGILMKLHKKANDNLEPILQAIAKLTTPNSKSYTKQFALMDLLPERKNSFFRYSGSLTTPGCNEIVVWTVFKDPIPVSDSQLSKIRSLGDTSPNMKQNYRPVQPRNGRVVFEIDTSASNTYVVCNVLLLLTISISSSRHFVT